ncbi:ATP-binding protein [Ramlibacter sp. H39-3-26]|uniref:sensor histidine kinase n=1 Tax=Curvibacter soli TaxID=3031331 RepID=UPI0023DBBE4F|nr:ATP-binding protein [Ramlibacter sp. H39-3-26]MDF1484552.1 ATP-binding protein [Ramlibacter sp. H39-3-26]
MTMDGPGDELSQLRRALAERERQLADARAAQEDLLRAVSHDLRAPVRHATAFGQLVRELVAERGGMEEALGYLDTMEQSARRMGRMIDGLLELSRIGRATLQRQPVDMAALVAGVRDELMAGAAATGRAIEWRIAPGLPAVPGDAAWLRVLWAHLLGNAVKFSRERAPAHIAVAWECGEDEAGAACCAFTVRDDGAGFDAAHAGPLFGVFQRLHPESEFEGVGTGLAAARAIVARHGGGIAIHGAPRQGCVVRFTLPLEVPAL